MAGLKILKQKEKKYAFRVFENEKQERPAQCVFKRFPMPDEKFYEGMRQDIAGKLDLNIEEIKKDKERATKKLLDQVVQTFLDNIAAGRIDYISFASDCIDHFEEFTVAETGKKIETVNEFLNLPPEAVHAILQDCYEYAHEMDEFSMGE